MRAKALALAVALALTGACRAADMPGAEVDAIHFVAGAGISSLVHLAFKPAHLDPWQKFACEFMVVHAAELIYISKTLPAAGQAAEWMGSGEAGAMAVSFSLDF